MKDEYNLKEAHAAVCTTLMREKVDLVVFAGQLRMTPKDLHEQLTASGDGITKAFIRLATTALSPKVGNQYSGFIKPFIQAVAQMESISPIEIDSLNARYEMQLNALKKARAVVPVKGVGGELSDDEIVARALAGLDVPVSSSAAGPSEPVFISPPPVVEVAAEPEIALKKEDLPAEPMQPKPMPKSRLPRPSQSKFPPENIIPIAALQSIMQASHLTVPILVAKLAEHSSEPQSTWSNRLYGLARAMPDASFQSLVAALNVSVAKGQHPSAAIEAAASDPAFLSHCAQTASHAPPQAYIRIHQGDSLYLAVEKLHQALGLPRLELAEQLAGNREFGSGTWYARISGVNAMPANDMVHLASALGVAIPEGSTAKEAIIKAASAIGAPSYNTSAVLKTVDADEGVYVLAKTNPLGLAVQKLCKTAGIKMHHLAVALSEPSGSTAYLQIISGQSKAKARHLDAIATFFHLPPNEDGDAPDMRLIFASRDAGVLQSVATYFKLRPHRSFPQRE